MPGIYEVTGSSGSARFAVNLDPAESRTLPIPGDELEGLGTPMVASAKPAATEAAKIDMQFAELENRQKLWRWFIVAAMLLLFAETWLAGRTTRKLTSPVPEAVAS